MKNRIFLSLCLCTLPALMPALSAAAQARTGLYGSPVPPSSGNRAIVITPDTRHVNMDHKVTAYIAPDPRYWGHP